MAVLVKFWSFCSLHFYSPSIFSCSVKYLNSKENAPILARSDPLPCSWFLPSIINLFSAVGPGQMRTSENCLKWRGDCDLVGRQTNQLDSVLILVVVNYASYSSGSLTLARFQPSGEARRQSRLNERWLCPTWDWLIRRRRPE